MPARRHSGRRGAPDQQVAPTEPPCRWLTALDDVVRRVATRCREVGADHVLRGRDGVRAVARRGAGARVDATRNRIGEGSTASAPASPRTVVAELLRIKSFPLPPQISSLPPKSVDDVVASASTDRRCRGAVMTSLASLPTIVARLAPQTNKIGIGRAGAMGAATAAPLRREAGRRRNRGSGDLKPMHHPSRGLVSRRAVPLAGQSGRSRPLIPNCVMRCLSTQGLIARNV